MPKLKKFDHLAGAQSMLFECPACDSPHVIYTEGTERPVWEWNRDMERPTFRPSILVRYPRIGTPNECICHSFITDGRIQYLDDCTHALAGQTIDLPEWSDD